MSEFFAENEYAICLVIGVVAVLNFAYKQLKLPLPGGHAEENIKSLQGSNVLNAAGRTLFLEAYIYFSLFLLALYFTLCFSESIWNIIFTEEKGGSNPQTSWDGNSGVWPLIVATAMVSLSAETWLLRDLELFFRKLSRYSAGIYRNVVKTKDRLNEVVFHSLPRTQYMQDIEPVLHLIRFYSTMSGESSNRLATQQKVLLRCLMLHQWTLASDSNVTWKSNAKKNASELLGSVSWRVEHIRQQISESYKNVKASSIDGKTLEDALNAAFPNGFSYDDKDTPAANEIWSKFEEKTLQEFELLTIAIDELGKETESLQDLLSILFTQDGSPDYSRKKDQALKKVLDHLRSFRSQVTRDLMLRLVLLVFVSSFAVSFIYIVWRNVTVVNAEWSTSFQAALKISWEQSIGFGSSAFVGLLTTLAYMRVCGERIILSARHDPIFPIWHVLIVFFMSALSVFITRVFLWCFDYLVDESLLFTGSGRALSETHIHQMLANFVAYKLHIEISDSLVMAALSVFFFFTIVKLDAGTYKTNKPFGVSYLTWSFLTAVGSMLIVVLIHSALIDANALSFHPKPNSSLLYLFIAFAAVFVPLVILQAVFNQVARHRLGV